MSKRISANGKKVLGYIVKLRGFCLILCVCPILAGCNKNSVDVKEKAEEEIVSMEEAEYSFPEKYEKSSDSGKVKFNCKADHHQDDSSVK